jgi:CubicO group peptidase (beta-lactamase class C family)
MVHRRRQGEELGRGCVDALMQGFPPGSEGQVTLANWRSFPHLRWAFQHVRELVPSADIANDPGDIEHLPARQADFAGLRIEAGNEPLTLDAFLERSDTDGIVVLHRGAVVLEHYGNGMTAGTPHILMSVSKSILGLIAGILVEKGVLDPARPLTDILPELAGTAYEGATVRHALDMRVGLAFAEDYLATAGPMVAYRKATNWNPLAPGEAPSDLRSFFRELRRRDGKHEGRFHYVSPNTDLLGWVLERASGRRYADLLSELLWRPMGATASAYITVDRLGAPRAAGGICATVRDLALLGQLLVQGGARAGRRIVPAEWIEDILRNGAPSAWDAGIFAPFFPGIPMHYRAKWYVERHAAPVMFGLGVYGQYLFVAPAQEVVIAKVSSQPPPLDGAQIALMTSAAAAIRQWLAPK